MSEPINTETRVALASLLEEALPPAEQAALETRMQNEPAVCDEYVALLRQDVLLGEISAERQYQATQATARAKPNPFQRKQTWIVAGAACVALALISWVALRGSQMPTETAVLSLLTGDANVHRDGKVIAAMEGMTLRTGDGLDVVGKDARTEVRFADGSRISAEQGTLWSWSPGLSRNPGERIVALQRGALSALIEKQNGSNSFSFVTLEARVTVIGTRFRFSNTGSTSTLELFEGAVRFRRNFDQQEISVAAGQRVAASRDTSVALVATPLNPPPTLTPPQANRKALLITAEPLPFYAHDVALQRALQKLGFDVELTTFDRATASQAETKDIVLVPSHKCGHLKILRDVSKPVIAWHNEWHRDLGLLSYDAPIDHAMKMRSVSWADAPPKEFDGFLRTTRASFDLSIYSSVPESKGAIRILKLNGPTARSPLVLFPNGTSVAPGPRAAFSIDIREGAGDGAPVEISEDLFAATVRWCLAQKDATK